MSPAKKSTRKVAKAPSPRSKRVAPKKSAAKKTARKKATKKKATKKKAAKKAPVKKKQAPQPKPKPTPKAVKPKAEKKKKSMPPVENKSVPRIPAVPPPDAHPRLGVKHTCYACGAKFYDLFRPEPLCPKCGADQREAPRVDPTLKPAPKPKRPRRTVISPLLDEDEEEALLDEDEGPGLDLDVAGAAFDDPADLEEEDTEL